MGLKKKTNWLYLLALFTEILFFFFFSISLKCCKSSRHFVSVCVSLYCPLQEGVCVCEEAYTEVLSPEGLLQQCALIPVLEIPTAGIEDEDTKTSRAVDPTASTTGEPGQTGRTWYLKPFGPGKQASFWFFKRICPLTQYALYENAGENCGAGSAY